jgi:hypothetical protein
VLEDKVTNMKLINVVVTVTIGTSIFTFVTNAAGEIDPIDLIDLKKDLKKI